MTHTQSNIPAGTYTFIHHGFEGDKLAPTLTLLSDSGTEFTTLTPQGFIGTLHFDTTQRFCTGWHNLATGESFPCPNTTAVMTTYHECRTCRDKTGFNPAFYNTSNISEQQQARNQLPHTLYLAHFAEGVVKVGISWAGRGIRRLLDQGARSYVILATLPNADIARQYEARIAQLPGIAETIQSRIKIQLLNQPYDTKQAAQELQIVRRTIIETLDFAADSTHPLHLDRHYIGDTRITAGRLIDLQKKISGEFLGMVGGLLIATQNNTQYYLATTKLRGYKVTIDNSETPNQHAPQQATLF